MRAIGFPFQLDPTGKINECRTYDDVVRGQVIDAVMTNQGERVMRPRYGCDIQAALFDPGDELVRRDAGSFIKDRLESFVSRSFVRSVKISLGDSVLGYEGVVYVDIVYRSTPYATDTSLTIPVSSEFLTRQGAITE